MHQRCTAGDASEMHHGGGYYENSALRRSASGFEDDGESDEGVGEGAQKGNFTNLYENGRVCRKERCARNPDRGRSL